MVASGPLPNAGEPTRSHNDVELYSIG